MNIAVIFAGGVGMRMNSNAKPKQFLELYGKAIIIHTLEIFENHPEIDGIVVSCLESWIGYLKALLLRFNIKKVVDIVPGGETGQLSIYNGLVVAEAHFPEDTIVLIHDGVRPLIDAQIITNNIRSVQKNGSAITTAPTTETFVLIDDDFSVVGVPQRSLSKLAKSPQSFVLKEILALQRQAFKDNISNAIDSCTLMNLYSKPLTLVEGPIENIKITTPTDYYIFKAILEARENSQILGL